MKSSAFSNGSLFCTILLPWWFILTGCDLPARPLPEGYSEKSIMDMEMSVKFDLVRQLQQEAVQFDRSFWQASKGDTIREFVRLIRARDPGIRLIYDDRGRVVELRNDHLRIKLKKPFFG